jgi:Xaa-Pro aminopeptidase
VKEPGELERIRKATDITAAGFQALFQAARPGAPEYAVKDAFLEAVHRLGARHLSYGSITGSGPDATVLHYPRDDRRLEAGELMVADCAAEYERYASDVTRTLPVGGKFSAEQRAVYELVLRAQEAAIARIKPGARWREDVDDTARQVIAEAGYGDYFIHGVGHFVGLDVHDPGLYDQPLPAGAVVTVEPGIYLPGKGLGVRIEDVVLVTPTGHEVLSRGIPKQAAELEQLLARP